MSGTRIKAFLRNWLQPIQAFQIEQHRDKTLLLLAVVVSAIVGLTVVGFVVLTERLGARVQHAGALQRFLTPTLGALVSGWLLYRFFPQARGSGIPQTRVALVLQRGMIRLKTVAGKFLCSSMTLASGVPLGREGPSVHIGAGIASVIGRRVGLGDESVRALIPVGTAAAVAAAFNTPLAAVLFTLEEILADMHARVVGSVVLGAATSWMVLRLILGDEPLFHVPAYQLVHPVEFCVYAILGLVGGIVSTAFVKLLLWQRSMFFRLPARWTPVTPAVGGLLVGLLAIFVPEVLGVGYHLVGDALNGQMIFSTMAMLLALRLVTTTSCYSSGNAGGIFGPSLFIGAMMGGSVGYVAHHLLPDLTANAGAYALVGMGAAFAGIVRTPMTSVIMIFEVTRDYTIIVPLMIANLLSYFIAQRMQKMPIYEALAFQDGITMPSPSHERTPLTVEDALLPVGDGAAYDPADPGVYPDTPLDEALQRMGDSGSTSLPVLSRIGGRRVGIVTLDSVLKAYSVRPAAHPEERPQPSGDQTVNRGWLRAVAALTFVTIAVVALLIYWQRSRNVERADQAYRAGLAQLEQGRVDDAVMSFRRAVANVPRDARSRTALGLALIRAGHLREARSYLNEVIRAEHNNGPALAGLAQVADAESSLEEAASLYARSLAANWPAPYSHSRRETELNYALLLSKMGQTDEAVARLMAIIGRYGDEALLGLKAAEQVQSIGSNQQAEAALKLLLKKFPADPEAWRRLGEVSEAEGKDAEALEAYNMASKSDPNNQLIAQSVRRMEQMRELDPTIRRLSIRERAHRWHQFLERTINQAGPCADPTLTAKAKAVLQKKSLTLAVSDEKKDMAMALWENAAPSCRTDPVLRRLFARLR